MGLAEAVKRFDDERILNAETIRPTGEAGTSLRAGGRGRGGWSTFERVEEPQRAEPSGARKLLHNVGTIDRHALIWSALCTKLATTAIEPRWSSPINRQQTHMHMYIPERANQL